MLRFAVACLLVGCSCSGGTMTEYRLHRDAESLGSFAGEGHLLAQAAAAGRAPSNYLATHASELGAECGDLTRVVRSTSATGDTRGARARLIRLSSQATRLFEQLEQSPSDQGRSNDIARRFSDIADQADKLEQAP